MLNNSPLSPRPPLQPELVRELRSLIYTESEVRSVVSDSATPWPVAYQAPLSLRFSRQEYWNKLLCPSPGYLSDPGIEPTSPASPTLQADSLPSEPPGKSIYTEVNCKNNLIKMDRRPKQAFL